MMRSSSMRRLGTALAVILAGSALTTVGPTAASAAPAGTDSIVYFRIVNWHSGKCVDVDGGSQQPGATIQQYTCNGTVAQQWRMVPKGDGFFELRVAASGQCMTVDNFSFADGARVRQRPCTGADNQEWRQVTSGVSGWPFLQVRHSFKGLTIASESLEDRAPLIQWEIGDDGPDTLHSGDWQFQ